MKWLNDKNINSYNHNGVNVFHSPIARKYLIATDEQIKEYVHNGKYAELFDVLTHYIPISKQRKVHTPSDYTLLTVLPNNICNFNCSYCYSAAGRNNTQLDLGKLLVAINYFLESKPQNFNRTLTISYMGGGEPLISWDIVSKGIAYAVEKAKNLNLKLQHRIITNGSILDEEQISFMKKYKIEVSVSFEIIREIQDIQRKNYDPVHNNIKKMIDSGIIVQINSTITPLNVSRMTEMLNLLHSEFPTIRSAMFEPVISSEVLHTPEEMNQFYNHYIAQFIASIKLADSYNIDLTSFAYLRTIYPLERACSGELCLTSDGNITGCYCVSSPKDKLFDKTCYGRVTQKKVEINHEAYQKIIATNIYTHNDCDECSIKWNCGGGCFYQYNSYPEEFRRTLCSFTQKFIKELIGYKIEKKLTFLADSNQIETCPILLNE